MKRTAVPAAVLLALVGATLARAQQTASAPTPRLVVKRLDAGGAKSWRVDSRLVFEVQLSHPCMTGAPLEEDFVLDPEGGWAQAIGLDVTDGSGAAVALAFTRHGGGDTGPLVLRRFSRRTLWFELDPDKQTVRPGEGPLRVVARLHATTGAWQGTATSTPLQFEVVAAPAPELTLVGATTLYRGWPASVAVTIRVPEDGDRVPLPTKPEDWAAVLQLTLRDETGVAVPDACVQLPVDPRLRGRLDRGGACVVQFQVPAAVTAALAAGRHRWTASLRIAPPATVDPAQDRSWSGAVAVGGDADCVTPPEPLPSELACEREQRFVRGELAQAALLRAEAERPVGYLGDRRRVAQRAASPLIAAERRALMCCKDNPDDASVCLLLAEVFAAGVDPDRARFWAGRAVAVDLERRRAAAGAGTDEAEQEPSLELAFLGEAITNSARPLDPDIAAAFQDALAALRRGEGDPVGAAPVPAAPQPQAAATGEAPTKVPAIAIGTVSSGDAATLDARFTVDAHGQWAAQAVASTQYSTDNYSAARATGAPDVPQHGDHANAWAPGSADGGPERLTLAFARAASATAVRVRQSCNPGALTRVELVGQGGERLVVFDGVDPGKYEPNTIGWFVVEFPATTFVVTRVELGLDTKKVPGWNEIDAVQLVGDPGKR